MKLLTKLSTSLILAIFSSQLMAQIEITAVAEVEVSQTNELGEKTVKRTAATSVVPGTEVIYTITAKNTGTEVADNIVVTNPVPEHTVYVDGSASGPDAVITFSADGGKTYDTARKLTANPVLHRQKTIATCAGPSSSTSTPASKPMSGIAHG